MKTTTETQRTIQFLAQDTLLTWIDAFLIDRKAGNAAKGTLMFYQQKLKLFTNFCETQAVTQVTQIDPNLIRNFLLWLEQTHHNKGGVHGCYRALRCFLYWWEQEVEPENWKNPIHRVKAPKQSQELLKEVPIKSIQAMLGTCDKATLTGARDRAIFVCLLDTGARASEFLALDLTDLDHVSGAVVIRHGKGDKGRVTYLGKSSRKAVRAYLKLRSDKEPALWITRAGERLRYDGLREVMTRHAKLAGVEEPCIHSFRRQFALSCLRAGMDIFSLQTLMGHTGLTVLRRYLNQTNQDTSEAHRRSGPVDRMI